MTEENVRILDEVSDFFKKLLKAAHLDLQFRCEPEDSVIHIRLHGRDAGMVLSNNARLLYAINHLLIQSFSRPHKDRYTFLVDCNEYRSTRELELQLMAQKAAERVKSSGTRLPLQPMPAVERRVIHMALAEEPGVKTASEGTGEFRRVVILPAQ
ncbi:MAG: hypothetical protein HY645_08945 [Acidobacteria bacterium]|nr:hypothetical protein [Acidobacteriota bacterium]